MSKDSTQGASAQRPTFFAEQDPARLQFAMEAAYEIESLSEAILRILAAGLDTDHPDLALLRAAAIRINRLNSTVMSAVDDYAVSSRELERAVRGIHAEGSVH